MERILMGDNPFLGVDHLSQERSRLRGVQSDPVSITRVITAALLAGAEGLVCSAHPTMKSAMAKMKQDDGKRKFGIYLVVPDAQYYVRVASERGIMGSLANFLARQTLVGKAKAVLGGGLSLLTLDPSQAMRTYLNAEMRAFKRTIPNSARVKGILLHEILTELIVSFGLRELAMEYVKYSINSFNVTPGFVTRNFPRFVEFVVSSDIPLKDLIVMAPFNSVGFQMNPSREASEECLRQLGGGNVIAMSILAGGYLNIDESIQYLHSLPRPVSCVVGVSTESHATETFSRLSSSMNRS